MRRIGADVDVDSGRVAWLLPLRQERSGHKEKE